MVAAAPLLPLDPPCAPSKLSMTAATRIAIRRTTIVDDVQQGAVSDVGAAGAAPVGPALSSGDGRDGGRSHFFTAAKQALFFAHLSEHANIRAAARHAGVCVQTVWRWRRKSAPFNRRWLAALAQGYDQLEMQLLAIARFGEHSESTVTVETDGSRHRISRRDVPAFGFRLLQHHRDRLAAYEAAIAASGREQSLVPGIESMLVLVQAIRARIADGAADAGSLPDAS